MTVAELLNASAAAHLEYRAAHDRKDPAAMREALQRAADLRQQAHAADRTHADRAWADFEKAYPHQKLTTFYAQQLAR